MTVIRSAVRRRLVLAAFVTVALGFFSESARAQSRPVNLERLVKDAGIIFSGTVVKIVTGEKDPGMNLYTTYYTFAVHDALLGVETDSVTIKQYGGESGGKSYYPPGVPRFERGETVVAFFYPPSKIGMTSAVAKDQGKFIVRDLDTSGVRFVENGTGNRMLFSKLRNPDRITRPEWVDPGAEGPIEYDPFISSVRNLVGALKKGEGRGGGTGKSG